MGVQKARLRALPLPLTSDTTLLVCGDEKSFLPLCHRASASARTYDTLGTVIVWALSTSPLKHKAWLFRGNHSMAPCLGSPCLVSDRTSRLPDKAAHSFDRWPDSLCNLSQLLACLGFSHAGSGVFLSGREASVLGHLVTNQRPLWGLLQPVAANHRNQITFSITLFSIWYFFWNKQAYSAPAWQTK